MRSRLISITVFFAVLLLALLLAPWWIMPLVAFGYGLWRSGASPGLEFWVGLIVGGLVYLLGALWFGSGGGLPAMLGELFSVGGAGGFYLVTALLGGLLAGLFAMFGAYTRTIVSPRRRTESFA